MVIAVLEALLKSCWAGIKSSYKYNCVDFRLGLGVAVYCNVGLV
jgi:hypothetical protein